MGLRKQQLERLRVQFLDTHKCGMGIPREIHKFPVECGCGCEAVRAEYIDGEFSFHCAECEKHLMVVAVRGVF